MPSGVPERIVCACSRVSAREIEAAIAKGAASLEALAREVDAGTGCRTCHPELRAMLAADALRRLSGRASPTVSRAEGASSGVASADTAGARDEDAADVGVVGFRLEPVPLRLGSRRRS